ncbi:beta-mannosidase [Anaerophaga thermohalophila]|uniref:beta-mannosidase n=1 Tax=Anaerophaga thermohalophila TaxID=177400 RepID=UPI000318DC28|nr:glycoside hydrolase family 2 protein [Anaerophaga thermohalophila]
MFQKKSLLGMLFFLSGILMFSGSCKEQFEGAPVTLEINDNWEFSQAGTDEWMPAKVPGTVHSDLMANGVIEDPHYRMNEDDVQWIEDEDWIYRTTFNVDESLLSGPDVIELAFKGLDTYADVFLNDTKILEADNMFVGWHVDVRENLVEGENELRIYFHSPVKEGMKKLKELEYTIPAVNEQAPEGERTNVFTRKAPFHYGWDWGPRLVTSGIWKPVVLKAWSKAVIEDIYVQTDQADEQTAKVSGYVTISTTKSGKYAIELELDGVSDGFSKNVELKQGTNEIPFELEVNDPKLWWTNGLGEPHLYSFNFSLKDEIRLLDTHQLNYGIRTLKLVQEPDETGHTFYFELNGIPVFMKGANVIPSETLTPLITKQRYQRLINNAVEANMNMIRIWGGAIYGDNYLYELCDENGILVWQDFMFACALQPGDEDHLENIRKEAEYNVKRLRNHPSLALWCGNNENFHGWHEWGWKEMYEPDVRDFVWNTYEKIFHEILPGAVEKYDPQRAYWPSSPMGYGGTKANRKSGDEHDWTIWFGQKPFSAYEEDVPRFVSEYGLQSFPSMHTIRQFTEKQDESYDSEVMRHRQRGRMPYIRPGFDGNDMIKWYMEQYYDVPDSFENFVYVSQLLQAKAYKTAIEAHRRNKPHCMGSLYWQLNDSWPTISWSTVDYYGRWKASHYFVREANEPIMISPVNEDGKVRVYAVNDYLQSISGELFVKLIDFEGNILFSEEVEAEVPANSSKIIFENSLAEKADGHELNSLLLSVEFQSGGQIIADNLLYFERPKALELPETKIEISSVKTPDGYSVTVSSKNLAKNVFLDTPDGSGHFSDNYFDILPGESVVVDLETDKDLDVENELIVTTLNDL